MMLSAQKMKAFLICESVQKDVDFKHNIIEQRYCLIAELRMFTLVSADRGVISMYLNHYVWV